MNRVTQNIPLAIDPASKDQTRVNRELTEVIRQLWIRVNKIEFAVEAVSVSTNTLLQQVSYLMAIMANTKRITSADSPYTMVITDHSIYCDTDGGAITVNLMPGVNKRFATIKNCGTSGNDVTITPDGTDLLFGLNASETLIDGEILDLQFETTEGWF